MSGVYRVGRSIGKSTTLTADPLWRVYLIRCYDGSLYCGATPDFERRFAQHQKGRGAKYTRGRGPLTPAVVSRLLSKGFALRLEAHVKKLPRTKKIAYLQTFV